MIQILFLVFASVFSLTATAGTSFFVPNRLNPDYFHQAESNQNSPKNILSNLFEKIAKPWVSFSEQALESLVDTNKGTQALSSVIQDPYLGKMSFEQAQALQEEFEALKEKQGFLKPKDETKLEHLRMYTENLAQHEKNSHQICKTEYLFKNKQITSPIDSQNTEPNLSNEMWSKKWVNQMADKIVPAFLSGQTNFEHPNENRNLTQIEIKKILFKSGCFGVLGKLTEPVDPQTELSNMGGDSIKAVDIRHCPEDKKLLQFKVIKLSEDEISRKFGSKEEASKWIFALGWLCISKPPAIQGNIRKIFYFFSKETCLFFGWEKNDEDSIWIPNHELFNRAIDVFNHGLEEGEKIAQKFHPCSGLIPDDQYAELIAKNLLPCSLTGREFYHDIHYHGLGILLFPPEKIEGLLKILKSKTSTDPEWLEQFDKMHGNLQFFVKHKESATETIHVTTPIKYLYNCSNDDLSLEFDKLVNERFQFIEERVAAITHK